MLGQPLFPAVDKIRRGIGEVQLEQPHAGGHGNEKGRPQPEPVGSFRVDESVYGMRDAAGAIREWTDSFYDHGRETRTLRGGAWYFNPHYCRLAFRHGYLPHIVFTNFGFRLARSAL